MKTTKEQYMLVYHRISENYPQYLSMIIEIGKTLFKEEGEIK